MLRGDDVLINGDGNTSRDFRYVENVVQANLLAATANNPGAINQVYNMAVGSKPRSTSRGASPLRWPNLRSCEKERACVSSFSR
jgi:nucleoside-diphosphate-sugar epimerase